MKNFAIAIDGPSGAGKSTVSKLAAAELSIIYVDTGAMYRAIGYYFLNKRQYTYEGLSSIQKSDLDPINIELSYREGKQVIILNGEDVTAEIRSQEIAKAASLVAAVGSVRKKLVAIQKFVAENNSVVMDGRDIGTVVIPNAQVKIYLDASARERAQRRMKELIERGLPLDGESSLETLEKEIVERDHRDMNREESPLRKAADAYLLNTDGLSIEQVKDRIVQMAREAGFIAAN